MLHNLSLIDVLFLSNCSVLSLFRWAFVKVFLELVYFSTLICTWIVVRFKRADFKKRAKMKNFSQIGLNRK